MTTYPISLPKNLVAYRRTPTFTTVTIPSGLRREHSTKPGVWALIHVLEGNLRYCVEAWQYDEILVAGTQGIVEPEVIHFIEPLGEVLFFVEFYAKAPETGQPHKGKNILP